MHTMDQFFPNQSKLGVFALICLLLLTSFTVIQTTGCTVTVAQIESNIDLILTQTGKILTLEGDTALAATIYNAQSVLQQAEAAWKGGGAIQDLISALNIFEIAIGAVPMTAIYSPLIDVIVAGIEFVLTNWAAAKGSVSAARASAPPNPHKDRLKLKPHMLQSPASAEKALWRATVNANPNLAAFAL